MKRFDVYYIDVCENVFVYKFISNYKKYPVTSEDQGLPEYVQKKKKKKGF